MSQEALERCVKVKDEIESFELSEALRAYPRAIESISKAKEFYKLWYEVYHEYGSQFHDDLIAPHKVEPKTADRITNLISRWVTSGQRNFSNIAKANICSETYLLCDEFYRVFGIEDRSFVLQEANNFTSRSLSAHFNDEFRQLDPIDDSRTKPIIVRMGPLDLYQINYDAAESNSALSWLLLLHEVSHDIYNRLNLRTIDPNVGKPQLTEVLLDMLVEHVVGPCYGLALAAYHRSYPTGGRTHPRESARLYALMKCANEFSTRQKTQGACKSVVDRAYGTMSQLWVVMKDQAKEEQTEVNQAYPGIDQSVHAFLKKAGIPIFDDFVISKERSDDQNDLTLERAVSMISEEIPVAVDFRMLYNSIFGYLPNTPLLVRESLKRWSVLRLWPAE